MMLTVLIPPLRTYLGGWENFTPDEGRTWELIGDFLLDPVSVSVCRRQPSAREGRQRSGALRERKVGRLLPRASRRPAS